MNKLTGTKKNSGRSFLALVLEPGNITRLQQGDPIHFEVEEMFPAGIPAKLDIDMFYSDTPVADAREFAKSAESVVDQRTEKTKAKRPHCGECKSTVEQMAVWKDKASPIALVFCTACGCIFGTISRAVIEIAGEPV